jgi:Fe-S oxidoreductase
MWMEERIGKRVNLDRVDEVIATETSAIATGCLFCRVMLTDGLTTRQTSLGCWVVRCGGACQSRGMVVAAPGSGGGGEADDLVPGGESGGHLVAVLDCGESVGSGSEVG